MRTYAEFSNAAELSKYPFSDGASLVDTVGNRIPDDFLLDVSFCFWGSGAPWLASLSQGRGSFCTEDGEVAFFDYSGKGTWPVFSSATGKETGIVVIGAASGIEEFRFDAPGSTLCSGCFCAFSGSTRVMSLAAGADGTQFRGNVRLHGKDGVYVTRTGDDEDELRIDIIGPSSIPPKCCEVPIRNIILVSRYCPIVSGIAASYDDASGPTILPGLISLRSALSLDSVCGKKEHFISEDGTIHASYCDEPSPVKPASCLEDSGPTTVKLRNGAIDFVAETDVSGGPSPVAIQALKTGSGGLSGRSTVKDLVAAGSSGTIILALKGRV